LPRSLIVERQASSLADRAAGPRPADLGSLDEAEEAADRQAIQRTSRAQIQLQYGGGVRRAEAAPAEEVQATAQAGVGGAGSELPHLDAVQDAFGEAHDLSGIRAHVGGAAGAAAADLGAEAYATGQDVAFAGPPSLHTAAHEAAHVVQQQAGVQLQGGIGQQGDAYEREADQVADAVVAGESAAPILGKYAARGETDGAAGRRVQRRIARPEPVQFRKDGPGGGGAGGAPGADLGDGGAEGASGASPAGEAATDPKHAKVARLYFLVDVDVKDLGLKDLMNGDVGHTWISLEYIDPHAVPETVHPSHQEHLKQSGRYADPMGFWPDTENGIYYSPNPFKSWVQGKMRHPDTAHNGMEKAVQVWQLTQAEVEQVIQYAESKRGAMYSVYFFNCTTFAKEAVQAAGKSPPSSSSGGICFPNAAYDGIRRRHEQEEGHTMVTDLDSNATSEVEGPEDGRKRR
jgi:hypothetical protein